MVKSLLFLLFFESLYHAFCLLPAFHSFDFPKHSSKSRVHVYSMTSENLYEQLKKKSNIVIDSSDIESISHLSKTGLRDVTTNPSLVLAALSSKKYDNLLNKALKNCQMPDDLYEIVATEFGAEILSQVPGWVCSQLDIQNADDTFLTVFKARQMMERYEALGVPRDRILIKLASTWEGIAAAEQLEKEGIRCLMTLTVSEVQARAAADAGASMIATYVGRVSDWHREKAGRAKAYPGEEDPGVQLTTNIQTYYREKGYKTEVMAASFRNLDQIKALAGCDHLTIAPRLIDKLFQTTSENEISGYTFGGGEEMSFDLTLENQQELEATFRGDPCAVSVYDQSFQTFLKDTRTVISFFDKKSALTQE